MATMPTTPPEILDLYVAELYPADDNPRRNLGDLTGLTASIKAVGVLEPLVVTPIDGTEPTSYRIVAGHRRAAAAKKAKLTSVPCMIRPALSDAERVEIMVIENLQREGLAPLEEAAAFEQLTGLGWTQKKVAERTGCTQSHVSKRLALLKLPEEARAAVDAGKVTIEVAVELTKLDDSTVAKLVKAADGHISEWKVRDAIDAAALERKRAKVAEPLEKKGLKRLGRPDYMKYEACTERLATHFWFDWQDRVAFACERPPRAERGGGKAAQAAPREETAKEKRARAAREARAAQKIAAMAAVVNDPDCDVNMLLAWWIFDTVEMIDLDDTVFRVLGLPVDPDNLDDAEDRLRAYLCTDSDHASRLAIALALIVPGWNGSTAEIEALRLLGTHGYKLDADDKKRIEKVAANQAAARERGYLPTPEIVTDAERYCRICGCTETNACQTLLGPCSWADDDLCTSCVDQAGTTADPDAPTTVKAVLDQQAKRDTKFVDDNQLQVGDEVNDDGSITRATDTDEISGTAPNEATSAGGENVPETSKRNGRKRTPRAAATTSS